MEKATHPELYATWKMSTQEARPQSNAVPATRKVGFDPQMPAVRNQFVMSAAGADRRKYLSRL